MSLFLLNSYRSRVGKGGPQGIYRSLSFSERWNQYAPGNIGAASTPRWVPFILPTSVASTDDGGVRVGGAVTAAGFGVGDGTGVAYTWSAGFAGQQTRSTYLATSDVAGARFDTRAPWSLSCTMTILDQTFPVIEGGLELFIPGDLPANKNGVKFLVGYDAGGYYARIVDGINGGGQISKIPLGLNWVPYATLIALNLSCDGSTITFTAGPAATPAGTLPNINLFIRGGTIGVHHNWNAGTVDKALGISNVQLRGTLY